ncbi:EIF2A [Acanthosepion pharaonis]|uniref:Eukaryotic translation initiation factor 2A n=1 Tax=Acanthosepion pharaonis TaxID=158019 RepID=A0A812B916_ACAPH|nr:EIF2A [Sepia pharaonis]
MATPIPTLAFRGSQGVWMMKGSPLTAQTESFRGDSRAVCRAMSFSLNGKYFAWSDDEKIHIVETSNCKKVQTIERPKTAGLSFSPLGTYLVSVDVASQSKADKDKPNLIIWNVATGELIKGFNHKRLGEWKPEWSPDDKIMTRLHNNDVEFYEKGSFETPIARIHATKISQYSLSNNNHVAFCIPGSKGQPSNVRVFKYPNINGCPVANKSFFKADKTSLHWNKSGNGLLVITSTETSASSYYGETGLHYLSVKGEGCLVPRAKDGPVYHVEWSPNSMEFCVVYGFMPAKATIYNLKCDPVFDFGTGPRNAAYYNPQGNILCLAGFGNLQGNLEFWDVKQKKLINTSKAMDTTYFCWCPDGEHFITATMAPRLRVGNGYKLWHYSGSILAQVDTPSGQELWESLWLPDMDRKYPEKAVSYKKATSTVAAVKEAKPVAAYRPPHARNQVSSTSTKLHDYEPPSNMKKIPGLDTSAIPTKNQKKKGNQKQKAQNQTQQFNIPGLAPVQPSDAEKEEQDKEKRKKNLKKKLTQINKLKEQLKNGKKLDNGQLEKISKYDEILKLVKDLEVS